MQYIRDYLARYRSRSLAHGKSQVGTSEPSPAARSGMVGAVTVKRSKEDQCHR